MVEASGAPLALYVHWPFCLSKCPYCDFNSHVRERIDHTRWRAALLAEMKHFAAETGPRHLSSIFFGGGTPSLMRPETVAALIKQAAALWGLAADAEITLEANPTSVEANRLEDLRAAGVNRVSLGVQALDDEALAFLGRGHSAAEAIEAVATARRLFQRHSIDLIYARPGQTVEQWRGELARALELVDEHISVYQLTIEKGTPFHAAFRRGELAPQDEDAETALYRATQEVLGKAGLDAYEVSNHARAGAECRHNLGYWRGHDYVGIGPGAHGRLSNDSGTETTEQRRAPEAWLDAVEGAGHGTRNRRVLSQAERLDEVVMMGLRLAKGLRRDDLKDRFGIEMDSVLDARRCACLVDAGYAESDDAGFRVTSEGRLRLNAVLEFLLTRK